MAVKHDIYTMCSSNESTGVSHFGIITEMGKNDNKLCTFPTCLINRLLYALVGIRLMKIIE